MANTTISYHSTGAFDAACDNFVVVAGSKESLANALSGDAFLRTVVLRTDAERSLATVTASQLSPGKDSGDSASLVLLSDSGSTRKVVLGLLSTACSRHNSPGRPHVLASMIQNNSMKADYTVVLLPESDEHVFAQAVAVARAFPRFSMQTSTQSAQQKVYVAIKFAKEPSDVVLRDISNVAEGIRHCQQLVDTPTNILHCGTYVEECERVAARTGAHIQVIQGRDLAAGGFGGIWGVGKASDHLPALVILSKNNEDANAKSVCLVGKGIVYDTGGLSIKVPPNMAGMKRDMGGSAAVLCAFEALVKSNCTVRVHALMCIAENSVSNEATRPDDIHTLYSGKTVEVNNTDAEGRLVLSDGCAFATANLNPGVVVDIATLTGAQLITTGKRHAAIYCNDEDLERVAVAQGRFSGDLTHPIPFCPEFFRAEFKSAVADMKNSVADRTNAQSSCAAQFVGNHIEVIIVLDCCSSFSLIEIHWDAFS